MSDHLPEHAVDGLAAGTPRVSVVIPVYNQLELLDRCLGSLETQAEVELQVLVVDDASPADPGPVLERHPAALLLRMGENGGYAAANNRGLKQAQGDYVLFLNSDTEFAPDTVRQLVDALEARPEAAGLAPLHRDPDGSIQRTCFRFPTLRLGLFWDSWLHRLRPAHPLFQWYTLADWDFTSERWVEHAQTSCLLVHRKVLDTIGGMDPKLVLFYNDTDYCYRMSRAGFPIRYVPEVEILHHGGASVGTTPLSEGRVYGDRYRYYRKWFGWRGALAIRSALWSRVGIEMLSE